MANKRISELSSRTPAASDLMLVGDPTTGYSYKCLVSQVGGVTSVFGRVGAVTAQEGDYSLDQLSGVTITSPASGDILTYNGSSWVNSAGGFVPYTGANQNVSLGEYGILAGWYRFDLTPTGTPTNQGTMFWDDSFKTVGLIMNGVTQEIGHDQFYHAKNSTGTTIPKGTAVRFAGTDGSSGHLLITPFLANGTNPSSYFMGVTAEAITNGNFGKVQSFGRLDGIDTSAFSEGDLLYASTTVAGGFQTTVPEAPNNIILVAAVISDSNNGKILVRPTLGSKLSSDESVKFTSLANGNVLQYNSSLAVWENVAPSSLSVSNLYTANGTLTGNRTVTSGGFTLTFTGNVSMASAAGNVVIGSGTVNSLGSYTVLSVIGRATDQGGVLKLATSNLSNDSLIFIDSGGLSFRTSTNDQINFQTNGNNLRMRIFSGGNIGINTTTDAGFRLDVNGTARVQGAALDFGTTSTSSTMQRIFSSNRSDFRMFSGGNSSDYFSMYFFGGAYGSNYVQIGVNDGVSSGNQGGAIYIDSRTGIANPIRFLVKGTGTTTMTEAMSVASSGNVGIGTTSPSDKLHVVGTGRITGNVTLALSTATVAIGSTSDANYKLSVDGSGRFYGGIRTAQPTGGVSVADWKLGSTATGTFTVDTGMCVEVEIGGTLRKLAIVT